MTTSTATKPIQFRYRPEEIVVQSDAPYANDQLGREPFIRAVVDLIQVIQQPFVVALNAPWGSGKTTALQFLVPELETAAMTTVSFNAWEVDYATDPLVPLVATLHDRLWEIKGYRNVNDEKITRFKRLAGAVAKQSLIAAVKVATVGALDLDAEANGVVKAVAEAAEKASEGLTGDLIDAFKKERQAAAEFRNVLHDLIAQARGGITEEDASPPLVLIIDELDRCRPTFAVAMLERIKHFFNVPGLVFILALDLDQLKASIRKVYGAELDSSEYLRRFVDLELRLPPAPVEKMVRAMLTNCGADVFFEARANYPTLKNDRHWVVETIKELALYFEISPRLVQRMISRLMLVLRQTPENKHLDPILAVFLIFLRIHDEVLAREYVAIHKSPDAVMQTLRGMRSSGETFYQSEIGILIEAHLLYALPSKSEWLENFRDGVKELESNKDSTSNMRLRFVYHRLQRCFCKIEHRFQVYTDHKVPLFFSHPHQQSVSGDPGIVHKNVNSAEIIYHLVYHSL